MPDIRLIAENRSEFGKGGARRTRRAGKIPAVIYGHGGATRHVALPAHEFATAVRRHGANALLTLIVDGRDELAIAKSIQRHPIKPEIEHVDLLAVRRGEQVTVEVPLTVRGDVAHGGLLTQEFTVLHVSAEATHIPAELLVDVSGLAVGAQVTAADVELPRGVALAGEPDQILLAIAPAPTAEQMEAETAEAAQELGAVPAAPSAPEGGASEGRSASGGDAGAAAES